MAVFVCRTESIHYRLYEFAKTALIKIFVSPYSSVCDLYCGGGEDTDKWYEAQISHYIGIDASSSGINEAREMWESQRRPYTAEFCELDPCVETLELFLQDKGIPTDLVCCLQHLQLCFETEERAKSLLRNVSSILKPGGFFFGITPDSSTIWFPLFGKKYQLKFAGDVSSETHCLVHFPSFIRLAREAGLEYVEIQNLTEFYDDNRAQFAGFLSSGGNLVDPRGRLLARSFDVLGLYTTFVFQKPDRDVVPSIGTPIMQDSSHFRRETSNLVSDSAPDARHSQAHHGSRSQYQDDWTGNYSSREREKQSGERRRQSSVEEEKDMHSEAPAGANVGFVEHPETQTGKSHLRGILGPGPMDLRFTESH
ncbi:mRNA cap guanine-N7 methyltransferase 2 isoform X2 [Amborella trichopoda]|uniref:mRNA cap guanine-N7 methyltransferase 2 isoform X2 n=1 Tax=Amborella trichopoda TaxID=13333 RepID=UPI0009BE002D|nr:mRNA cap guanine-N7 methyltransferase 2 isoform X2 [Amborella trichopoda]|eukprot:XP_020527379.1 mRNA cap guanine-N7 methyltransferase 2 isoform X2 [Amborella trichopoda]